jgi:uncharacterized membrane protein YccC
LKNEKGEVKLEKLTNSIGSSLGIAIFIMSIGSWFTHLYVCFTEERWGFLIAGAIFFPIAIVHGFGAWFGFW